MSHTLHRQDKTNTLKEDYVLTIISAPGYNRKGATPKMQRFLKIMSEHNPVNLGVPKRGIKQTATLEQLLAAIDDGNSVHAVFDNQRDFEAALEEVKKADLGISVTATGLFADVRQTCQHIGLTPHTVQYSLGVWGDKKKYMPSDAVLDVVTMCGHGLVPAALVEKLIKDVREGRRTVEEAGNELSRICPCGTFNTKRAADIVAGAAKS